MGREPFFTDAQQADIETAEDVSWSAGQIARMASGSRLLACATLRATK